MHNKWLGIVMLILISLGLWIGLDYRAALTKPLVTGNSILIEIDKGDSFARISEKLQARQLPISVLWLKFYAWQTGAFKKIKTGEYELNTGLTLPELLRLLVSGKTKQYALTFPEGWTFKQILQAMMDNPYLDHTLKETTDISLLLAKCGTTQQYPEGLFFPDTYFFAKHTSDLELLQRAYAKMQTVIQQEWRKKSNNLPFKNPYEALIMASIIEKETGAASERAMIAGVFVRRLQQGMRLQTDPTVIYGMGDSYQGDIRSQDLKTPTPYNTYLLNGLPPTPIAMPGREAIIAALHPDKSENLYFVARGDGSHIFSATLAAHNAAVAHFQRKKNDAR